MNCAPRSFPEWTRPWALPWRGQLGVLGLLLAWLAAGPALAATIEVSLERNPVRLNESFTLNFTADESPDGEPDFEPLPEEKDDIPF